MAKEGYYSRVPIGARLGEIGMVGAQNRHLGAGSVSTRKVRNRAITAPKARDVLFYTISEDFSGGSFNPGIWNHTTTGENAEITAGSASITMNVGPNSGMSIKSFRASSLLERGEYRQEARWWVSAGTPIWRVGLEPVTGVLYPGGGGPSALIQAGSSPGTIKFATSGDNVNFETTDNVPFAYGNYNTTLIEVLDGHVRLFVNSELVADHTQETVNSTMAIFAIENNTGSDFYNMRLDYVIQSYL